MATMSIRYEGGKRISAERRGHLVMCDQPEKAGGEDTAPTPFDMLVGALGMCMLYFAHTFLERRGHSSEGLALDLEFEMDTKHRRLARVAGRLRAPGAELPHGRGVGRLKDALVRAALACPVHNSLREDIEVTLELVEDGTTDGTTG